MKLIIIFTLLTLQATIVMSQDISWVEQSTGVTTKLNCIDGAPNNYRNIWACGNNGTVLWSNDLGDTWINTGGAGLPSGISLNSITVIDSNTAVTSGQIASNTFVFKTTNKGADWIQVFYQPNGYINAISQDARFMSGNPVEGRWSIWKSMDRGSTWDSSGLFLAQSDGETGLNNSMCVLYDGKIWIGTNSSRIYYSSDFGQNWQVQTILNEQGIYSIMFQGQNGFAGGDNLYRTTNNGAAWDQITSTGSGKISSIVIPVYLMPVHDNNYMPDIFYSRHNSNQIYKASEINNGISFTSSTGSYTFLSSNLNSIFAVKDNGGITAGFQHITGWNEPVNYPYSFELKQNYPNPFNPKTTIPIVLYGTGNISLKIYNSSGELVSTLLDGQLIYPTFYDAMVYGYPFTIEWDATNYPSGIYFYEVVGFDHKETKKMILVK
jgi:photosystem II stability/assembly factor-like uncharacterized protein